MAGRWRWMCSKPKTARRWRAGRAVTFVLQLWWRCVTRRRPAEPTLPLPAAGCSGWRGVRSNVLEHSGAWSSLQLGRGCQKLSALRDRRAGSILQQDEPIIKHSICCIFTCDDILGMKSSDFRMTYKPEPTDKNQKLLLNQTWDPVCLILNYVLYQLLTR